MARPTNTNKQEMNVLLSVVEKLTGLENQLVSLYRINSDVEGFDKLDNAIVEAKRAAKVRISELLG